MDARPPELDSDDWLGRELAGGAGVRGLSRRLRTSPSTVRRALRDYAARRTSVAVAPGSNPERRFAEATRRVEQANVALERARRLQASAVVELRRSGLTPAAIADRLRIADREVDVILAYDSTCSVSDV